MKKTLYHNWLFLFGFIYYLVLPLIVEQYNYLSDMPGMHLFYINFPNQEQMNNYYLLSSLFFISFFSGSYFSLLFKKKTTIAAQQYQVNRRKHFNSWILYLLVIFNQYLIVSNKDILFSGYTTGYHVDTLGQLASLNCLYVFLYLYLKKSSFRNKKNILFLKLLLLENSVILLGFGSRMFVLIPLLSFVVYLLDNKIIKTKKIIIPLILSILIFLIVGVIRQGSSSLNLDKLIFIAIAEPLFTWISAGSFIQMNQTINIIDIPYNFLGTFLNFVPSFIFPNKADFIKSIPYAYEAPLGAGSIVVMLYGNFGLLLAPVVAFIGGFLLTVIRYTKSYFFRIFYYCVCGLIPFILFRDMQSFNKLLFTSFLLYPLIILNLNFGSAKILKKVNL